MLHDAFAYHVTYSFVWSLKFEENKRFFVHPMSVICCVSLHIRQ